MEHNTPACWPTCPSFIVLANWDQFMRSHPDEMFAAYIHTGLSNGFRIGFNRQRSQLRSTPKNHPSAASNPQIVKEYIENEVSTGRPLSHALLPLIKTSPIGLIPKAHQPGEWHMIVDLSYPFKHTGISEELSSITYARVNDAVACILQLGPGTELVKLDLTNAYRIHLHDHHHFSWEGETYIDRALPFGLRSAPKFSQLWQI